MTNILQEMLLIDDPSIFRLYQELIKIANYFIAPVFTISLILEFFGEMNFASSVKKLFLVVIFMGAFYNFHSSATAIALDSANKTLRRVSPTNLFIKKWTQSKIKTKKQKGWNALKDILIPNLNDLIGTSFFVLAKIFIWLLKLIYSSVYHLTYVFAGFTAILYFLGWTKDALKGTVQASIWCMAMPFVIVAILALVGNSIEDSALNGDLVIAKIDTIIWLFGVTLLLLISPLITYGMIRGDGIHSFGSKMGAMVVSSGLKAMAFYPIMMRMMTMMRNNTVKPFKNVSGNFLKRMNFGGNQDNKKSQEQKKLNNKVNSKNNLSTNKSAPKIEKKNVKNESRPQIKENSPKKHTKNVIKSNRTNERLRTNKPIQKTRPETNIPKNNHQKIKESPARIEKSKSTEKRQLQKEVKNNIKRKEEFKTKRRTR
jgi:hypothetical protein